MPKLEFKRYGTSDHPMMMGHVNVNGSEILVTIESVLTCSGGRYDGVNFWFGEGDRRKRYSYLLFTDRGVPIDFRIENKGYIRDRDLAEALIDQLPKLGLWVLEESFAL